jgi:dCMP deaminase
MRSKATENPKGSKRQILLAYVPVIHEGYRRFFEKYPKAELYVLASDVLNEIEFLGKGKDVRALSPGNAVMLLRSAKTCTKVDLADAAFFKKLASVDEPVQIIANRDDVIEDILTKYLPGREIIWDSVFLRWDKKNTTAENVIAPDRKTTAEKFHQEIMASVEEEALKSPDWWRRNSALIIKDGKVVVHKFNSYVPDEHQADYEGDPRAEFHKGVNLELSLAMHAEAWCVAEAARDGIKLEGTEMYCTTFPCPPCAKQIAFAGIKKLYYSKGYAVLDGERILKDKGVEIIFVETPGK